MSSATRWAALAAEDRGDFTDINVDTALWTLIAFGLTYLILSKLAWPALVSTLEERELRIAAGLRRAEEAEALARQLMEEGTRILDEARKEAQQLLAAARAAAEQEGDALLRSAQERLAEERRAARADIARERAEAVEDLKRVAAELTVLTAGKLLKRPVDDEHHLRLAREIVDDAAVAAMAA